MIANFVRRPFAAHTPADEAPDIDSLGDSLAGAVKAGREFKDARKPTSKTKKDEIAGFAYDECMRAIKAGRWSEYCELVQ